MEIGFLDVILAWRRGTEQGTAGLPKMKERLLGQLLEGQAWEGASQESEK
jgi:hypothetical protein